MATIGGLLQFSGGEIHRRRLIRNDVRATFIADHEFPDEKITEDTSDLTKWLRDTDTMVLQLLWADCQFYQQHPVFELLKRNGVIVDISDKKDEIFVSLPEHTLIHDYDCINHFVRAFNRLKSEKIEMIRFSDARKIRTGFLENSPKGRSLGTNPTYHSIRLSDLSPIWKPITEKEFEKIFIERLKEKTYPTDKYFGLIFDTTYKHELGDQCSGVIKFYVPPMSTMVGGDRSVLKLTNERYIVNWMNMVTRICHSEMFDSSALENAIKSGELKEHPEEPRRRRINRPVSTLKDLPWSGIKAKKVTKIERDKERDLLDNYETSKRTWPGICDQAEKTLASRKARNNTRKDEYNKKTDSSRNMKKENENEQKK